eukprot:Skav223409  [mRNA]  locus=scaffold350:99843:106891:- [translate_table: standard]
MVMWWVIWWMFWTAAGSCVREDSGCDEVEEVLFLQVQQNVTQLMESSGHQASVLAGRVKQIDDALRSELIQTAQLLNIGAPSFGTFLLDAVLIVVVVIFCSACICALCFKGVFGTMIGSSKDDRVSGRATPAERPSFSQSQVAEIPTISQRYVVPSSESHFIVDMNEVMDTGRSSFAINSSSGTKLLEATISQGPMLSITPVNSSSPENVSSLSMKVFPLLDSVKDTMVASSSRSGNSLKIQVSMNFDGCLFLGCLLGIIVLEPPLIQMAVA